jgi:hypothetical protein
MTTGSINPPLQASMPAQRTRFDTAGKGGSFGMSVVSADMIYSLVWPVRKPKVGPKSQCGFLGGGASFTVKAASLDSSWERWAHVQAVRASKTPRNERLMIGSRKRKPISSMHWIVEAKEELQIMGIEAGGCRYSE